MKLTPHCVLCNLNAGIMAIREVTQDERLTRELLAEIMRIPAMRALDWSITGSQLVEEIFKRIRAVTGNPDPLARWKREQNEGFLKLYPALKKMITQSDDPLYMAANLAVLGNSIDPMGHQDQRDIEQAVRGSLANPIPPSRFNDLRNRIEKSRRIVYLGDNSGEIVLDKLFIETIKQFFDVEVTFVVRAVPALNDATLMEATIVGMQSVAAVIENGIDGPLPGTILSRCSDRFRQAWSAADLVISKGGGNFDSLDEEESFPMPLYYLLMCKCIPYRDYFNIPLNHPILARAHQSPSDPARIP